MSNTDVIDITNVLKKNLPSAYGQSIKKSQAEVDALLQAAQSGEEMTPHQSMIFQKAMGDLSAKTELFTKTLQKMLEMTLSSIQKI